MKFEKSDPRSSMVREKRRYDQSVIRKDQEDKATDEGKIEKRMVLL